MVERTADRARGRWRSILPSLGVDARYLKPRHGPCPICGGKDRFRFDDKDGRGTYICCPDGNGCGAGDGLKLVMAVKGIGFAEAAKLVDELVGTAPVTPWRPERSEEEARAARIQLWQSGRRVSAEDPVGRYLAARVGLRIFPGCIRTVARARYDADPPTWHPAMVAVLQAPDGSAVSLHRTYLSDDGHKADVEQPRLLMPGRIGKKGVAVRLFDPTETLGIAEGLETAWAAASLFSVPVWAATNSGLLAQWEPPEGPRELIVFGDNDAKFGGQAAAHNLAHRLAREGRTVRVEVPDIVGEDWADVLMRKG